MQNRLITPPNVFLQALLKTPFRPEPLLIDGKKFSYMRLETPIEIDDLYAFMEAQTLFPKIYFETPRDAVRCALGQALVLDHLPSFESVEGPRFYGGRDFMPRTHTTWKEFPETAYVLPLIEIEKRSSGIVLCLNRLEEKVEASLEMETTVSCHAKALSRLDSPSYPVWEREVQEILKGIRKEEFLKIVPARCSCFKCDTPLKTFPFLKKLKGDNRFVYQFSKDSAFVCLSPETLYRRKGRTVESAAVAGTRPRGKTEAEDQMLTDELLMNTKEQHEFQIVSQMIHKTLSPLCTSIERKDKKVLKTPTVQHLYHRFKGHLKQETSDQALIDALHPTPAVGGMPKDKALEEIGKRERFDRGWYAAPFGWVSPEEGHHLVGIRSAFLEGHHLLLFAGTGIVSGSVPSKEWDELEHKIKQYVTVL